MHSYSRRHGDLASHRRKHFKEALLEIEVDPDVMMSENASLDKEQEDNAAENEQDQEVEKKVEAAKKETEVSEV